MVVIVTNWRQSRQERQWQPSEMSKGFGGIMLRVVVALAFSQTDGDHPSDKVAKGLYWSWLGGASPDRGVLVARRAATCLRMHRRRLRLLDYARHFVERLVDDVCRVRFCSGGAW